MNLVVTLLVGMLSIRPTDGLSLQGCGEGATSIRGRIVGGKLSRPGMWPWQVGIHKQSIFDSTRYDIICGGALIAPQWVLTAAHCFYTRRASSSKIWYEEDTTSLKRYKVIAGDINTQIREISEQEKFPTEVYIHPGYRHAPYYENDIALVKLNQNVTLSSLVRTVCLPISNVDFAKPGTVGTVAGWGRTRKSRISTVLTHTTIAIKDNAICKQATTYFFNKTVTFCAGDGNGRNDTCQGDSGGSLVRSVSVNNQRRWVTVGLVSWGEGCGLPGKYGYYTRVHSFVDWIKDTIDNSLLSCGNPGNIPFGRLIKAHRMKRFPIDFRVKYRCVDGYVLKGKSARKCKGESKWTSPPVCVREITCPDPGHPDNGVRRPSRRSYSHKTNIQFYCNKDHVMIGRSSLSCQIDGTWNGYPPLCLASCPDPGVPKHGVRLGNNFKHGQTVRFICKNNSKINGLSLMICFNGKWIGDTPKCYESCTKPRHTPNGYVSPRKDFYYDGETVQMYCNRDYVRVGNSSARCGNGKWNNDPPSCKRTCNNPGSPHNGWKVGNDFFEGKQVSFRCTNGYNLIGLSIIQCLDTGRWSGSVPECKRRCSYGSPSNSKLSFKTALGLSLKHGSTIDHSCTNGYTLFGQKTTKCDDGRWRPSIPKCKGNCRGIGNVLNAVINKNNDRQNVQNIIGVVYKHGDRIAIRCNNGSRIKGNPVLKCNDGTWSDNTPKCIGVCPNINSPQHGERLGLNFDYGSTIRFRCNVGYTLRGNKRVTCNNGTWSNNVPVCKECGSPIGMENRKIPDKNIQASSRWNWRSYAKYGRLNGGFAWCSSLSDRKPYLEIDLGKPYKITYLATQGGDRKWVSKYLVSHNLAGSYFIEYRESSKEKVFTGNSDATSIVKHKLKEPFIARKIRFLPLAYNRACMRVEVYGCDLPNDCVMVGSRVLGRWEDNYNGGDIYIKAIVRTIDRYNVQLEIEDGNQRDDSFKSILKTELVLDVPNEQLNLPKGTRVLMPWNNKYYTGTIASGLHQDYYQVDPANSKIRKMWMKKNEIRVLKLEQFCE